MRKSLNIALLIVIVGLPLLEAASFVGGKLLTRYKLFYVPSGSEGYAEYLAARDPELGWPSPSKLGTGEIDARGSRIAPSYPNPDAGPACVSVFGDSFTFGDEVTPAESYPNVLARQLGCRVNNFGVNGYGTDQALLRYRRLADQPAKFVVLGHYSDDIVRNVNQLRDLHAGGRFGLKPRFVLKNDELRLIPLPRLDAADFARIVDDHERLLPYEFFRPGGDAGIVPLRFPYTWHLMNVVGQYRVQARLRGVTSWAPFYEANHPSGAFDVTVAILVAFVREAEARGQTPLVLVIPDLADLNTLRAGRPLPYAPLVRVLRARGIEPLDAGVELDRTLGKGETCAIYRACSRGHLTPEGNTALAKLVADRLRALAPADYQFSSSKSGGER